LRQIRIGPVRVLWRCLVDLLLTRASSAQATASKRGPFITSEESTSGRALLDKLDTPRSPRSVGRGARVADELRVPRAADDHSPADSVPSSAGRSRGHGGSGMDGPAAPLGGEEAGCDPDPCPRCGVDQGGGCTPKDLTREDEGGRASRTGRRSWC
jgi:hypothetical protein